jgi:hypothetical protein
MEPFLRAGHVRQLGGEKSPRGRAYLRENLLHCVFVAEKGLLGFATPKSVLSKHRSFLAEGKAVRGIHPKFNVHEATM